MSASGYDENSEVDLERIRHLLDLTAAPAIFNVAEDTGLTGALEELNTQELPYFSFWSAPYEEWKRRRHSKGEHFLLKKDAEIISLMKQCRFQQADVLSQSLMEPKRSYYRALITISCHDLIRQGEISESCARDILSLEGSRDALRKLVEQNNQKETAHSLELLLSQNYFFLNEWENGIECLGHVFLRSLAELGTQKKSQKDRLLQAAQITADYYHILIFSIPNEILVQNPEYCFPPPDLMQPAKAAKELENSAGTDQLPVQLCCDIADLMLANQSPEKAKLWVDRALEAEPDSMEALQIARLLDSIIEM